MSTVAVFGVPVVGARRRVRVLDLVHCSGIRVRAAVIRLREDSLVLRRSEGRGSVAIAEVHHVAVAKHDVDGSVTKHSARSMAAVLMRIPGNHYHGLLPIAAGIVQWRPECRLHFAPAGRRDTPKSLFWRPNPSYNARTSLKSSVRGHALGKRHFGISAASRSRSSVDCNA